MSSHSRIVTPQLTLKNRYIYSSHPLHGKRLTISLLTTLLSSRHIPSDLTTSLVFNFTILLTPLTLLIQDLSTSSISKSPAPTYLETMTTAFHAPTPLTHQIRTLQTKRSGLHTAVKSVFWEELWDVWHSVFVLKQMRRPVSVRMERQEWILYCAKEARERILGLLLFDDEEDEQRTTFKTDLKILR